MSKTCKKCHFNNPNDAHYCARCGKPLETKNGSSLDVKYIVIEEAEYRLLRNQRTSFFRQEQQLKEQLDLSWIWQKRKKYRF